MRRMRFLWISMILAALLVVPAMAVQLGVQSFETESGYTVTPGYGQGTTPAEDYFGRYTVATKPTGLSTLLGSLDGSYFLAGEDTDAGGTLPANGIHTVAIDAVSVAGYVNLTVKIALNAKNANKYDTASKTNGDYLKVYCNFDGAGDVLVGQFTLVSLTDSSNGKFGQDLNLDGHGDVEIPDYSNFNNYTFNVSGTGSNLVVKVVTRFESGDEEIVYDNIRVDGEPGGPTYESDAHVVGGGGGGGAYISSLVDTQPEKQIVHTCQIYDDGLGTFNTNTTINGITYVKGDNDGTSDWTTYIAGAELYDGTNTYVGVVAASTIAFSGLPPIILTDGGAAVDLQLALWLKPLPYDADHVRLEFVLGPSNFAIDPLGSHFANDTPVESGWDKNAIEVVATDIGITTQPPLTVGVEVGFLVRAGFVDENGGVDKDWNQNITVSVNTGSGNLHSNSGLTIMSSLGQSNFYNLQYDALETGVILQATSLSFPGPALTNPFDTYLAPIIDIDSYPLCWDGDATVDALPFVVHVSITGWTAAAGQQAHLKLYQTDGNLWQYSPYLLPIAGWTNSTSFGTTKPIAMIDANGNWDGWLPAKSNGFAAIRPRARLVNNTTVQITGVDVYGTALDLSVAGAIVQDSDGSTDATPGNTILAINESGDIIGSYLAEDNAIPLDGDMVPGGWRLAMCGACDEGITFQSWLPAEWPGNGSPEFEDTDYNICEEEGGTVEVGGDVKLPVNLSSFTALAGDGSVAIHWVTASESDLSRFNLRRDGELVFSVEAANSVTGHEYSWTDEDLTNGTTYTYDLYTVDIAGHAELIETVEATPTFTEGVVTEYALHQNFPNPFNPETAVAFDLVNGGFVSLKVYNLLGQEVAVLVNGTMNAGRHVVNFRANDLPSGVYLYRIETEGFSAQMKMVLMK